MSYYFIITEFILTSMKNFYSLFLGGLILTAFATPDTFADVLPEKNDSITNLKEVVVKGKAPVVKTQGSVTTIKVKGTLLEKMGNGMEMLSQTPGLHLTASGIEVNDLGSPIFVMGGKVVDADRVMSMVRSNMVKEIKIDRNPDAEYSSTGRPVVEIIMTKPLNDFLFLDVDNFLSIRRQVTDFPGFNFAMKTGKFTSELTYSAGIWQNENRESYFREIFSDANLLSLMQNRTTKMKEYPQQVRWRSDFTINRRNRLGLEYYYKFEKSKYCDTGSDVALDEATDATDIFYSDRKNVSNLHNISLQYNHIGKKWSMSFVQDLLFKASHDNTSFTSTPEHWDGQEESAGSGQSRRHDRYTLLNSNLKFNVTLPLKLRLNSGIKYTYINSDATTESIESGIISQMNSLIADINEHHPQIYATLSGTYKKFRLSAGVTYRYLYRLVNNHQPGGSPVETKYHLSQFYPSVSLTYSGKNINGYVRYSRSVSQPNFGAIGTGLLYIDEYTYREGNPDLRASVSNNLRGSVSYKGLTFSVNWRHTTDPRVMVSEQYAPGSLVIVMKELNFPKQSNTSFNLSYSKSIRNFFFFAEGSMYLSKGKYEFLDRIHDDTHISFNANSNVTYQLSNTVGFYASFNFQGRHTNLIMTQRSLNDLTAGMTLSLLKNRLSINAKFTDILNKAHYNNLWYTWGNISRGTRGTNDMHGFSLSISYRIFTKDIKVKMMRDSDSEMFRLQ